MRQALLGREPPITETAALQRVTDGLNALKPDKELAEIIRQYLIKTNKQEAQERIQTANKAGKALEEAKQKIDKLIDLQLTNALPQELFKDKLKSLQEEQAHLEALKQENAVDEREFEVSVEEVLDLAQNAVEIFMGSQMAGKKQILNCVFANLTMKQKNLYFLYKKPFDLLVKGSNFFKSYPIDEKLLPEYIQAVMDRAAQIRILKAHLAASGIRVNWRAGRPL